MEILDLVDENDLVIGKEERTNCISKKKEKCSCNQPVYLYTRQ